MASEEHHASSDEYETPSGSEYSFFDEKESPKYYSDDDEFWNSDKESGDDKDGSSDERDDSGDLKFGSGDKKVGSTDIVAGSEHENVTASKKTVGTKGIDGEADDDGEQGLPKEIIDYISRNRKTPLPIPGDEPKPSDDHDHDTPHSKYVHHRRKNPRHILLSRVLMPSEKLCAITVPGQISAGWKCGDKTKLITLRPNGEMGKREYTIVKKEMEKTRSSVGTGKYSGYDIIKIQKLMNPCLWEKYKNRRTDIIQEAGEANENMLFHGSQNVQDIVQSGFDERHASLSGLFGAGLYFARNSSKSNMYVFGSKGCPRHHDFNCFICERKLFLCRVVLGKVSLMNGAQKIAHAPPGFQSVEGRPIPEMPRYSEFVVYRGEQAYPEYLITYKLIK